MTTQSDGKVVIGTELDNSGIQKDAKQMAASLAAEYRKAGMSASEAFKKAWAEVRKTAATSEVPVIDLNTGQVSQAGAAALATANEAAEAAQKAVSSANSAVDAAAQATDSLTGTAQGVSTVSAAITSQDEKIQRILADTERSAKSKAAAIAAIYRQQGYSQQEAFKKAWDQIERESAKSTKKVGQNIRANVGGSTRAVKGELGGLKNVVGKLGTAIGAAFSVAAIVQFAAESVKAANELSDALTGLRSILDGQGRSFSDAESFLEEYTADGLIPMTNAVAAYKNLASRGYDDSQIRQVMVALKDASAFGRQASYSMGEAVQSATEGLKNENSVLVDNAGVTKNVAKMWEEYAASIGTTANNLTQQQKNQAEVNGILEATQYQTGDAAKVAGTLSGQLQQLSKSFHDLKVAIGNALTPIVQSFLPIINAAVSAATRLANAIASVVGLLFGTSVSSTATAAEGVADSYNSAAAGAENLAEATEGAGKAAKKYLAGFDEITKIGDSSGGGGGSSTSSGGGSVSVGTTVATDGEVQDKVSPKVQAVVDKIHELIEPLKNIDFGPTEEALGELGEAFEDLGVTILDALEWAWFNLLVPLAEWSIEEYGPESIKTTTTVLESLNKVLKPVLSGLEKMLKHLKPIAKYMSENLNPTLEMAEKAFESLADVVEEKGEDIEYIIEGIGEIIAIVWKAMEPVLQTMQKVYEETFESIAESCGEQFGYVVDTIKGIIELISNVLCGDWEAAWEGLADAAKGVVNILISMLNSVIGAIETVVNAIIGMLNKIDIDIPNWGIFGDLAGQQFGFNLSKVSYDRIPQLAQGAVLPANKPFLAMVGDQKHGTNVEAPLATIQEAVALVMQDYAASNLAGQEAVVSVLREILEAVLGIEIGDEVIGQAVARYNRKMAVVRGGT